jgi:hypothetical protein
MTTILAERDLVHQRLCQWIGDDPRRLGVLADLMVAIPLSRSVQGPDLAQHIIREVQDQSILQMLRRFYSNEQISWERTYVPLVKQVVAQLDLPVYYFGTLSPATRDTPQKRSRSSCSSGSMSTFSPISRSSSWVIVSLMG